MAENSKIEWTDHTVNLWWGCTKVHAGCDNCYAEYFSDVRYKNDLWGEGKNRKRIKSAFSNLTKFQRQAESEGKKVRVFVGSMMDIFEKSKPLSNPIGNCPETGNLRAFLFAQIMLGVYDNIDFLLLTKRPSNINKMIPSPWKTNPPSNVWFGTSPVDQNTWDNLVPMLGKVNGNKFLSVEPQLGPISWKNNNAEEHGIGWIIQGGESGHNKRPFDLDWATTMQNYCEGYEIPYFFKQIDKVQAIPDNHMIRQTPFNQQTQQI